MRPGMRLNSEALLDAPSLVIDARRDSRAESAIERLDHVQEDFFENGGL
jgi:hypothetical protein